ncbi:MAG: aminotransferase class I/II-fold pyridoxal phosphate-dependent enzyme [Spirochaetia bacterium]|nr:aminotransferase class I/II-fold pyridoxal phosphate-dependent enzyme [Spirochaetia bacterium]
MLINENNPHGGDIYTYKDMLDFSANINPFGIPEPVKAAVANAIDNCTAYPDPYCRALRNRLSVEERVPEKWILCGNGAAELIYSFAYSLPKDKPALIVSPTFSEYQSALSAAGIPAEHHMLEEKNGFVLDDNIMNIDFSRYSALLICTPDNPTGITVRPELLERLAATGIRLFCDMCFIDLTDSPDRYNVPELLKKYPNLVVLKAFTKSFAIPGLRLGYMLCSDEAFMAAMSEKAPCWNVSVPAQAAGCAALDCKEWLSDSVKTIREERKRMADALCSMGIKVYPGEANFLLLYSDTDLYGRLLEKGILIRDCSNYKGLRKGFIRIAIRKPEENDQLLSAVREVLK